MGKHGTQAVVRDQDAQASMSRRVLPCLAQTLLALFAIVSVVLVAVERWLFDTWAALSVDEIIYHLSVSLEGTDTSTIWGFVRSYLPFALLGAVLLLVALYLGAKRAGRARIVSSLGVLAVSVGLMSFALVDAGHRVNLADYLAGAVSGNRSSEDFTAGHYVDPASVELEFPERRRNLIFIFLESMEVTYADEASGGAFEDNTIPELTQLARDNEDFSGSSDQLNGGIVFSGCDWTMGGMFAQTSGIPLKVPLAGERLADCDELFPGLVTLGDLLEGRGYHQELLLGSDVKFGGRDAYFTPHGNYEIYDYVWAQESGFIPEDYKVFWGFEDEKLFALLKRRLTALADQDEPFNVTALTVDTHFEDGYVCNLCDDEFGDNQYANVMACSSRQVYRLVKWVQRQDFYENTTIVVSGDHVTMDRDFCADVPQDYQRRTYTVVINPAVPVADPSRTRSYATFDLFPTTLAALGVTIPGDRLGLGTNLFSATDTLVEEYGVEELTSRLNRQSEFLTSYSELKIDEEYMAAAAEKTALSAEVTDAGYVRFSLSDACFFKPDGIERVKLLLTDTRTNETTTYEMTVEKRSDNDPNRFNCYLDTSYIEGDLPYLRAEALMTAGECTDYPIATFEDAV